MGLKIARTKFSGKGKTRKPGNFLKSLKLRTMDAKDLGTWGRMFEVNDNIHITQTNENSNDGKGAHVTTCFNGIPVKIHDSFDAEGNFLGSDFTTNGW